MGWDCVYPMGKQVLVRAPALPTAGRRDAGARPGDEGCRPQEGFGAGRGDTVSFVHLLCGVLSWCCAEPTGALAERGSRGSRGTHPAAAALHGLRLAASICVCLAFPPRFHANEGRWKEAAAAPCSSSIAQLGSQLPCGYRIFPCLGRGLL